MMISEGGWKLRSYFNRYSAPKFTKFLDDVETIVSVKFRARDIGTQIAHFLDPTFHFFILRKRHKVQNGEDNWRQFQPFE